MVMKHNHEGIINLQPSEGNFRGRYRELHGTTKNSTKAYRKHYNIKGKK